MDADHRLALVLGGARSGKSRHAEALITALPPPWIYVATAEALDDEMAARIAEPASSSLASTCFASGAMPPVLAQPAIINENVRTVSAASPFGTGDCTIYSLS